MLAITPKKMELAVRPQTRSGLRSPKERCNDKEEPTIGQLLQITSVKGDLYAFREELRRREYPVGGGGAARCLCFGSDGASPPKQA